MTKLCACSRGIGKKDTK